MGGWLLVGDGSLHHFFEELDPTQTKLTWVVEAEGFGISVIGRLIAKIYTKDLDKAIPLLIRDMNTQTASA